MHIYMHADWQTLGDGPNCLRNTDHGELTEGEKAQYSWPQGSSLGHVYILQVLFSKKSQNIL